MVAIEVGRYELRPLIDLLEERGSTDFFGDVGGITAARWEGWIHEGLTAVEASAAAASLGTLVTAIWPEWAPETETSPDEALSRIEELRCQLKVLSSEETASA